MKQKTTIGPQQIITARVRREDIEKLKAANINVSDLVRECIAKAAKRVKRC